MKKLTPAQQKVYDFLLSKKDEGIPPTIREICEATGFKSTSTVHAHLNSLEKLGYIKRLPNSRGISVNEADGTPGSVAVRVVVGFESGKPVYEADIGQGCVIVDERVKRGRQMMALRVSDDSMLGAGILKNDTVVFVRQSEAENGDIVAVWTGSELTVKRYCRENGSCFLKSENPVFPVLDCKGKKIIGKVIAVIRNYE